MRHLVVCQPLPLEAGHKVVYEYAEQVPEAVRGRPVVAEHHHVGIVGIVVVYDLAHHRVLGDDAGLPYVDVVSVLPVVHQVVHAESADGVLVVVAFFYQAVGYLIVAGEPLSVCDQREGRIRDGYEVAYYVLGKGKQVLYGSVFYEALVHVEAPVDVPVEYVLHMHEELYCAHFGVEQHHVLHGSGVLGKLGVYHRGNYAGLILRRCVKSLRQPAYDELSGVCVLSLSEKAHTAEGPALILGITERISVAQRV